MDLFIVRRGIFVSRFPPIERKRETKGEGHSPAILVHQVVTLGERAPASADGWGNSHLGVLTTYFLLKKKAPHAPAPQVACDI